MTDRDTGNSSTAGAVPLVAGHTSGPWSAELANADATDGTQKFWMVVAGPRREAVTQMPWLWLGIQPWDEANARLIAAAPKMLAALLRVRDLSAAKDDLTPMCSDIYDQMDAIFGVAQNILREMGHAADEATKAGA